MSAKSEELYDKALDLIQGGQVLKVSPRSRSR